MKRNLWNRATQKKNWLLFIIGLIGLLPLGQVYAQETTPPEPWVLQNAPNVKLYRDDYYMGNPDAKIVIIEYASLTCPHCANFHSSFLPNLKKDFIDTGKALFVFRDFPLDQYAYQATIIAQCAPRDRYFTVIDQLFVNQRSWVGSNDISAALENFAQTVGLGAEKLTACYNDQALTDRVVRLYREAYNDYQVRGTPSLVINGQLKSNFRNYEELQQYLNSLPN